jgi:hypothetical protein
LGHPARDRDVQRREAVLGLSRLMFAQIKCKLPSRDHSRMENKPPSGTPRRGRAWEIAGNQVGRWEAQGIQGSTLQHNWGSIIGSSPFMMRALHGHLQITS